MMAVRRKKRKKQTYSILYMVVLGVVLSIVLQIFFHGRSEVLNYFTFPDRDSVYFKTNVQGIMASIERAFASCPGTKHSLSEPVEIIFESQRPPSVSRFIQFQMEQLHSTLFQGEAYVSKLRMASQIWAFSETSAKRLVERLDVKPGSGPTVHVIPMMLTYQSAVGMFTKKISMKTILDENIIRGNPSVEFTSFTRHCYAHWTRTKDSDGSNMAFEVARLENSACGKRPCESDKMNSRRLYLDQKDVDILVFGFLSCSHKNAREEVCTLLEEQGFHVLCLHQVFGSLLDYFIQHAKIILNVEFYGDSSLATHRIDPLVLNGKVVVSLHSSDAGLDRLYTPLVQFTTEESLLVDIRRVLASYETISKNMSSKPVKQYISRNLMDITPLCHALGELH